MFVGWYRLLCNGLLFGKRERQREQFFPFGKNRRFGFDAEPKATRKEEFLCLLKIRSIS